MAPGTLRPEASGLDPRPGGRWRAWVCPGWVVALSLLILAPTLAPGFTLSYDLVFTPRQSLLPGSLGIGGGLPRAVPQDAVVAIVEYVVPGMLLEKAVLLAIPIVAGLGICRLLNAGSAGLIGATLAIVNPFVAERLVIGHWGLLLAYAVAPWAILLAVRVRTRSPGAAIRLLLVLAIAALTPSGGILVALLVVPIAVGPGSRQRISTRLLLVLGGIALMLPWIVPALLHPAATGLDPASLRVFALRSEGPWGALMTALGGGGIWNSQVVPASRGWWSAPAMTIAFLALAAVGWPRLRTLLGRAAVYWWTAVALAGIAVALSSVWLPGPWADVMAAVPGGGLLRDAQKGLAPLVLLLSAAAGLGAARLLSRIADTTVRRAAVVGALVLPLALMPDIAWGVSGRLATAEYPPDWASVRQIVSDDSRAGDVVVLPWSTFRRFPWNADRTVLDPAPRWLPRTTVTADVLAVSTRDGVVEVRGDDPRAAAVGAALDPARSGGAAELGRLGIGWVLVERGQLPPARVPVGLQPVYAGNDLELYAVPSSLVCLPSSTSADAVTVDCGRQTGWGWVVAVDLAVAALILVLVALGIGGAVVRRSRPHRTPEFDSV